MLVGALEHLPPNKLADEGGDEDSQAFDPTALVEEAEP